MEYLPPPPMPGKGKQMHTPARNKGVSEKWRLRLHEAVRMLCVIFDQVLWGEIARLNVDVATDAKNYEGIGISNFGYNQVILYADEFYSLAGDLGYEGHAFTDELTFTSPNTLSNVRVCEGTVLVAGDIPMMPVPPAVVRAEYARIHTFGDSMAWFIRSNGKDYTRAGAYLKQFCFYNLDDHTKRGVGVAQIIAQIRDFFKNWSADDLTKTVVPKGMHQHDTNVERQG
jgi:hypothetical protein